MSSVLWVRHLVPGDVRDVEPAEGVAPTLAMSYDDEASLNVIALALEQNFLGWPTPLVGDEDTDGERREEPPHILGPDGPVALMPGHFVVMVASYWRVVDPVTFKREFRVIDDLTQVLGRLTDSPARRGRPRRAG